MLPHMLAIRWDVKHMRQHSANKRILSQNSRRIGLQPPFCCPVPAVAVSIYTAEILRTKVYFTSFLWYFKMSLFLQFRIVYTD